MQLSTAIPGWKRSLRLLIPIGAALLAAIAFRDILIPTLGVLFGACALAFLLEPLARAFEKRLRPSVAALAAVLIALGIAALFLYALFPPMIRQALALAKTLPSTIDALRKTLERASVWLKAHAAIELPSLSFGTAALPGLATGTMTIAGGVADAFYKITLAVILAYFLVCDRCRLMMRAELLIPLRARKTAVRMGAAIAREMRMYLRGQALIALAVGSVASVGLYAVGLPSPLVLGAIVGVLNMIPYFGPVLGGIPAVLFALGFGWKRALLTVFVLWLVQQIDETLISPRILGNLSGLSPAAVLIALFTGSCAGGIVGMLLALPAVMAVRTAFRVYAQRNE